MNGLMILLILVGLLVALAVIAGLGLVLIYNVLVRKRIRCDEAWGQIDVQLKRRYDLIPNLVQTVKGYAKHESETLERVVQARQQAIDAGSVAEQSQAENMLTGALRQLFALQESYPDLKANQNFLQLQEELTSTENRIAFARQHYNSSVAEYNTARQTFPSNMVAGMFGFTERDYFELEDQEMRQPPQVSF